MKNLQYIVAAAAISLLGASASAGTQAYWNFENGVA